MVKKTWSKVISEKNKKVRRTKESLLIKKQQTRWVLVEITEKKNERRSAKKKVSKKIKKIKVICLK